MPTGLRVALIGRWAGRGRADYAAWWLAWVASDAASCHIIHGKLSGCLRSSGFVRKYSQECKKEVRGLSRGALLALDGYDWPGNVRDSRTSSSAAWLSPPAR
jgi:hypothetical protein